MNAQISAKTIQNLIDAARKAQMNAYAPYSKFQVGAALLAENGEIIAGANVENASYPAAICAERSAVCSAIAQGLRNFVAIGLMTSGAKPAWPCGICRQVLAEFAPNMPVYSAGNSGEVEMSTVAELLPKRFGPDDLP